MWVELVWYSDSLLPEQVGQLLDSSAPEQVWQRVKVPDIELVVQRTAEAHANEIRGEENQHNLWLSVKKFMQKLVNTRNIIHLLSDMFSQFKIHT